MGDLVKGLSPDRALAVLCRRSFFRFVQEFWAEVIPEDPVWNWHIEMLCNEAQEIIMRLIKQDPKIGFNGTILRPGKPREAKLYDLLVNIPPGTTKSTIFSVMLHPWAWTLDATLRIGSGSYSQSLSIDFAIKSRDIIQSDKYKKLFAVIKAASEASSLALSGSSTIHRCAWKPVAVPVTDVT